MNEDEFRAFADRVVTEMVRWESVKLDIQAEKAADHQWPPPPNTAHPALAHQATFVRQLMADGRHNIILPRPQRASFLAYGDGATVEKSATTLLTVHRVWGLAPYVGDPFIYVWSVAVDGSKRWVAGDSHSQYR